MSNIFNGLDIAQRALYAQQLGLEVTQRNIGNVNTPGYSRLRVSFESAVDSDPAQVWAGIEGFTIDSFRNRFVDYSISRQLQGQGEQQAAFDALQQVEALFNDSGDLGLASSLSAFFNSFSALANTPEDLTLRQQVLLKGQALAADFNRVYDSVKAIQLQQDRRIAETVGEINNLATGIARLNTEIAVAKVAQPMEASALRDQQQRLLNSLSELVDISYHEDSSGMLTVSTRQGTTLVVGAESRELELGLSQVNGLQSVLAGGTDISSSIQSGALGGILRVRDSVIAGILKSLDDLAAGLIAQVNAQHAQGADLSGSAGGDFFAPFSQPAPGSNEGAARNISVLIADPAAIAAADSAAGSGSNANALRLAGLSDKAIGALGGLTTNDFYANLIFRLGSDTRTAEDELQTQKDLVLQLQNQRDSFSGVNLDDEAVNIIKYQRAYQASARFVTVIDSLTAELMDLIGR